MYTFESLRAAGVSVAAMSDKSDGDCRHGFDESSGRGAFLAGLNMDPQRLATLHQVHGTHVAMVDGEWPAFDTTVPRLEGDGLITALQGVTIGVTVADCVPVLLFDPRTRAVAALHAGREGTAMGIVAAGIERLVAEYGVNPVDLRGAIGPSAGPCCYEVSEEIAARCAGEGVVVQGRYLDLWSTNLRALEDAGVKNENIEISRQCTICSPGFFSYRGDSTVHRNLALIRA